MKKIYLFISALILVLPVSGQDIPEWGDITPETFSFSDSLADSADAVILGDIGSMSVVVEEGTIYAEYEYYQRVLVKNSKGVKHAHFEIPLKANNPQDYLLKVEGGSYWLDESGALVHIDWFQEDMTESYNQDKGQRVWSIDAPGARENSIIEYRCKIRSEDLFELKPWFFQHDVPCLVSRYSTTWPEQLDYFNMFKGSNQGVQFEDYEEEASLMAGVSAYQGVGMPEISWEEDRARFFTKIYTIRKLIPWVDRAYLASPKNFSPHLIFQLSRSGLGRRDKGIVIANWENLVSFLVDHPGFGRATEASSNILVAAKRLTYKMKTEEEKARAIYDFVRKNISWDGTYTFWSPNLQNAINNMRGSSADINWVLYGMLKSAELTAYPVILSTREHGRINSYYPILQQFNHMAVIVAVGDSFVFLDAMTEILPFAMIPRADLNGVGLLIDEERWGWVNISSDSKVIRRIFTRLEVNPGGSLKGEVFATFGDYAAVSSNTDYQQDPDAHNFVRQYVLQDTCCINVKDANVELANDEKLTFVAKSNIDTDQFIRVVDDLIIIDPLLSSGLEYNPLTEPNRPVPIEFPTPIEDRFTLTLAIPQGVKIVQTPHPVRAVLPHNAGEFIYSVERDPTMIILSSLVKVNPSFLENSSYEDIRAFFEYVRSKHEEDVILRRVRE